MSLELAPVSHQSGAILATLSIKNAPNSAVDRLRHRAARNHRSLRGELKAIIEAVAAEEDRPPGDPMAVLDRVRAMGLNSASDSVEIIRAMRDARSGR